MQAEFGHKASARPTGEVTFLFSDIEGSTVRWESSPDAMARALARHDELLRGVIEAHGGYVFKTMGDAFCAAFGRPREATAAALAAQRALFAEDFSGVDGLRVRMALHSGTCQERDGDYFGPTVNRVARLLATGHGGQVLLSHACAQFLQGDAPQFTLRDLGNHRLKDLSQPEYVYQLVSPDLPDTFPELLSLDHLSNNLPAQLTSFVGRDDVMAQVLTLLARHRLVTLVGTGGAGKTRCAIQVGAELLDDSGDGVWLAELAPISDTTLVTGAIARALNVQAAPNSPILDTLIGFLKRKRLLLILDNCEHVIEEARILAASILRACPGVRILVTSREALNIEGEVLYRIPSLAVPPKAELLSPQNILGFGASLLFSDRASSGNNRFALTDENALHVAEICRRLDGIPLAIELAAARVKVLTPKQIAQMLDERFRLLTGGDPTALPRQQTMRALIDWSFDLLSVQERALFRKLSIFAGGFTLEAVATVCSGSDMDEITILDLLSSLVDKSLLQAEQVESGMRYRFLESTRQYARERLDEHGEYAAVAQAHASAFLALAEQLRRSWETTPDRKWFAEIEPELENFRAALSWSLSGRGNVLLGQQLAGALHQAWWSLASAEGRRWVQIARDLSNDHTPLPVMAALDLAEAELAASLVQYAASRTACERALERYREIGDPMGIAYAQRCLGLALIFLGKIEQGEALLGPALSQARALGARRLTGVALQTLADARHSVGDVSEARRLHAEALANLQAVGAERTAANVCVNLGEAEFHGGNAQEALRWANEALTTHRAFNATRGVAFAQINMTAYLTALERYDEARLSARAAIGVARDAQLQVGTAWALQHLAATVVLPANPKPAHEERNRAARLLGYADTRLRELRSSREFTEQQEYEKMLAALRAALDADEVAQLMREGSSWTEDHAVAEAMRIL
jgi:predicted ATPase/class 3 adenylate cyclase